MQLRKVISYRRIEMDKISKDQVRKVRQRAQRIHQNDTEIRAFLVNGQTKYLCGKCRKKLAVTSMLQELPSLIEVARHNGCERCI